MSVELLGKEKIQDKLSRFEELTGASLSFLGVSSPGSPRDIATLLPCKLGFNASILVFVLLDSLSNGRSETE